ncbi:hypothetical protein [Desulfurispira natronophila]|uniref:Uncharacterized protein n=1 Tax=Desulfurispira natronophila TaxID=682562 RepID=A0A7W7Y3E8_9BACT|nr:hypothetical protein [Desulfurispira natronophila]MBB5021366.1 hypothetical protein [Desulfurispira natronophila]
MSSDNVQRPERPTPEIIHRYLDQWNTLESYTLQERSLNKLFKELCPRIDNFHTFKKSDLKSYVNFKTAVEKFRCFYGLEQFSLKEVDVYLWLAGKEYFPKQYNRVDQR